MQHWLATRAAQQARTWIKRFDPVYWQVDFPRPMMASVVTTGPTSLRVDTVFYRRDDLAGLIWLSDDSVSHPLLAYETARDYRRTTLSFRWRSAGVMPLDAINGPTLTIEGRDEAGAPRSWYVRLWNHAKGTPQAADITLDFAKIDGGFLLPGEADPVWAGDVDRMFVSLVPPAYDGSATPLAAPVEGWVSIDDIACDGSGSVLEVGDVLVPPHGIGMATGYDDSYNLTPARLVRTIVRLGYRGAVNHYVGMSHYYRLERSGEGFYVSLAGGVLNAPCAAWHRDWAERLHAAGLGQIVSLSYELFDANCWNDWKQRAHDGASARTGWLPPSTLLSPANTGAMDYLKQVARAFVGLTVAAGQAPAFQIGEPWWWVNPGGAPCLYDDAARAAFDGSPPVITDVNAPTSAAQRVLLDQAGALLAASTAALFASVRAAHPACERLMLVYLPTVLDAAAPDMTRANVPVGWAGAFDTLQLEDYDWVTSGNTAASARGAAVMTARLGYGADRQHYLSGFVLRTDERAQWRPIADALSAAQKRGVATRFVWALPQVMRDGLTLFNVGSENDMQAFDDVLFPLALGREASVEPGYSTAIVTTAGGHEQRNADWASARMRYDAGPGVRSQDAIATLIAFFRARRGPAKAFRFTDPFDNSSNAMSGVPAPVDQPLGTGDGSRTRFALVKRYGGTGSDAELRAITRPVAVSVRVSVAGVERTSGWSLTDGGVVAFDMPPASGARVSAGFRFDVPVRFAEDRLTVSTATFLAGEAAHVPLIEVRE